MTAGVEAVQPWSRLRWAATITFVVGIHLVLALAFSNRPLMQQRRAASTRVILPEGMAPDLQTLTDPTLLALGGPRSFSSIWLETPELQPVKTDWEQPPQWLALGPEALGERFLKFAQSNASALHELSFKIQPKTFPLTPHATAQPLRTESTLQATEGLAGRTLLSQPDLPSWPATDLLAPSEVRVVVNARGFVISAILQSGSGSVEADQYAVSQARQMRFSSLPQAFDNVPPTLGRLVFQWHTQAKPE